MQVNILDVSDLSATCAPLPPTLLTPLHPNSVLPGCVCSVVGYRTAEVGGPTACSSQIITDL